MFHFDTKTISQLTDSNNIKGRDLNDLGLIDNTNHFITSNEPNERIEYSRILKLTHPYMYGEDVKAVQNRLNELGFSVGIVDGNYNESTRDAVIKLQKFSRLHVNGVVRSDVWDILFNVPKQYLEFQSIEINTEDEKIPYGLSLNDIEMHSKKFGNIFYKNNIPLQKKEGF